MNYTALVTSIAVAALLAGCGPSAEPGDPSAASEAAEAESLAETTAPAETELASAPLAGVDRDMPDVNQAYADFLTDYVTSSDGVNLVAYARVTPDDRAALQAYIDGLEAMGTGGLSDDEAMAFWFNLYNAVTIEVILDNYPLKSIRSLGAFNRGPWDRKLVTVAGKGEMSLNDIEHATLRAEWDEPRIHYAVNCASYNCPNLMNRPWEAATLDGDLDAAARAYVNHPRGISVSGGRVTASSIYDWYKADFGGSDAGVLAHVRQYADEDLKAALDGVTEIARFDYDWDLNE